MQVENPVFTERSNSANSLQQRASITTAHGGADRRDAIIRGCGQMETQLRNAKNAETIQSLVESITPFHVKPVNKNRDFTFDDVVGNPAADIARFDSKQRELSYREALEHEKCSKKTQAFIVEHSRDLNTLQTALNASPYAKIRKLAQHKADVRFFGVELVPRYCVGA